MNDRPNKCANPACNCVAANDSDYCSAYCEGVGKTPNVVCNCNHPACTPATVSES